MLPPLNELAIGDTFRVVGVGSGGWAVNPAEGETIRLSALSGGDGNWIPHVGFQASTASIVREMSLSADGRTIVTGVGDVSKNGGATWVRATGTSAFQPSSVGTSGGHVWVSRDGERAILSNGSVHVRSTDGGLNFSPITMPVGFMAAAADGQHVAMFFPVSGSVPPSFHHFTSEDFGLTWSGILGDGQRLTVLAAALSDDGDRFIVVCANSSVFLKTTPNSNFISHLLFPNARDARVSGDGSAFYLSRTVSGSSPLKEIWFVSRDNGTNWYPVPLPDPTGIWDFELASDDGSVLVAAGVNGVAVSHDFGAHWTSISKPAALVVDSQPELQLLDGIAASADGSRIVASGLVGLAAGGSARTVFTEPTMPGAALVGRRDDSVELVYVGDGQFSITSFVGALTLR